MKANKKRKLKILGFKLKDIIQLGTILGVFFWGWQELDNKFDRIDEKFDAIDRRFETVDQHFEHIEGRLNNIETELTRTGDLIDLYLTWRFVYVNDPARRNLTPIYDRRTRTLEFVPRK